MTDAGTDAGAPLVVTLDLDAAAQQRFDRERSQLFPAGRTAVGAHVTLFHALPPHLADDVRSALADLARRPPPPVAVTEPYPLGRGVAYRLRCPELVEPHAGLQARWRAHLTRQDAQPLGLHVTVQNKVDPAVARSTLERLRAGFTPFETRGAGIGLWRYQRGPWRALAHYPFLDPEDAG